MKLNLRLTAFFAAAVLGLTGTIAAQPKIKKTGNKTIITTPTPTPDANANKPNTPKKPDAQMQTVLDNLQALKPKPIEKLSAGEARYQPTPADAVKYTLQKQNKSLQPEQVGSVEEIMVKGAAGDIPARVYTPSGTGPFPVIMYIHGGGWVIASINTYDSSARALTNAAKAIVVSIEYRKGPEYKFPSAHDDSIAAYQWLLTNAAALGGDARKIAVVGESAGGNLACNVSIAARDKKLQMPVHQVLIYPIANNDLNSPSMRENANAKPLNRPMIEWFLDNYLNSKTESGDPRIALVKANLRGLPPTTIILAEIDPLRSEGELLAQRLRAANVRVGLQLYTGVTHEFFGMGAVVDKAKSAVAESGKQLTAAFNSVK